MGEIDFNAQGDITIGGDVVGRDKITNTFTNIEAAAPLALNLHQLPPPPRDFTGRAAELTELMAAVEAGGVTISGLHGLGGIGKTALAIKLAEALTPRYPDAQFYLDLKGMAAGTAGDKPLTPAEALAHVIRAYYPTSKLPDSETELRALYQSLLHGKRALLLMDNAKDATQVESLLPPATCYLLVTSRQHFTLPGLFAKNLEQMPPEDARALLLKIAPRLASVETRDGASLPDEIARLCAYLPLALRLTASALAERIDLSPVDLIRRLQDAQTLLKLTGVDTSLQLSYDLLTPEFQKLWRALAVFPDTFDRAAGAAVWALETDPSQDTLSELVKYSLLDYLPGLAPTPTLPRSEEQRTGEGVTPPSPVGKFPDRGGAGGGGRYRLHDLARLFAAARLPDPDRYEAQKRHAQHYETVFRTANNLYLEGGESIMHGLALFEMEWSSIRIGQAWAEAHTVEDKTAATLCNGYAGQGALLGLRQHPRERIPWLEAALNAARLLKDRSAEGVHLGNLGLAYTDLGDIRKAIELHEQTLTIARETGNRRDEGNALGSLGIAYYYLGENRRAVEFYKQQLRITRKIGDRRGEGVALGNLGLAYADLGETRQAANFYEEALVIAREIGDHRSEGGWLGNLGIVYSGLGEFRRAIEFYEQALAIARKIGDRHSEGNTLGNLGNAYAQLRKPDKAMELYEQQLKISRETNDRRSEANALMNTGNVYQLIGQPRHAIEYHEQALPVFHELGDRRGEGNALGNMSLALEEVGERTQAIVQAEAALKIFEQLEDPSAEKVRKQLAKWRGQAVKKKRRRRK